MIGKVLGGITPNPSPARLAFRLFIEAILYTKCAFFIADAFGTPQSGFFAIFLGAAGLTRRFGEILDENRRDIFNRGRSSLRANAVSAGHVLSIFLGAFCVFVTAALLLGETGMARAFGFVIEMARLGNQTIVTRTFAAIIPLFLHNALVLVAFFALSLVYRIYGALLALFWNACVWGLVLAFLIRRGMLASELHPFLFVSGSILAVLPHLVLEAAGYIVGSLAAIFLSKSIFKHSPREPAFWSVMSAVAVLSAIALVCLFLGACVEATLPRLILSRLQH